MACVNFVVTKRTLTCTSIDASLRDTYPEGHSFHSMCVFTSYDCSNKLPQPGWPKETKMCSFTVLGPEVLVNMWAGLCSLWDPRAKPTLCRFQLLVVAYISELKDAGLQPLLLWSRCFFLSMWLLCVCVLKLPFMRMYMSVFRACLDDPACLLSRYLT